MTYSQYLRIEQRAGGVTCTRAQFVRASHKLLGKRGRSSACRALRHAWIRRGLAIHSAEVGTWKRYS